MTEKLINRLKSLAFNNIVLGFTFSILMVVGMTGSAWGQTILFSETFESASANTKLSTTGYIGWYNYAITSTNNKWWVMNSTNTQVLTGSYSMAISKNTPATSGTLPQYNNTTASEHVAYYGTKINATNSSSLRLSFKWICNGEASYDYGKVCYSTDAVNWINFTNSGTYQGQTSTQIVSNLDISELDGQQFYLGFRWTNDASAGSNPAFIVDDISVTSCAPTGDPSTYGTGSWIGYVYQSNSAGQFGAYKGYVTESETFDRMHTSPSGATSNHCTSSQDLFAIRYRMTKNFPAGYYKFTIGGDDGVRLSLDGGSTWHINDWTNHGYTTYTSSSAVYLSGNTNLVFEYYENTGGAQSSFSYILIPANDACSNATTLTVGASAISGTLTNATYESPFTDKKEVWYQFTPSCTGDHSITLNGLVDDKDLYVYTGSCGSLTEINYSATSGSSAEYITSPFNSGVTYHVAVYDWENTGGTFNIGVSGPPAPSQPSSITGTLDPVPGSAQVYSVTNVSGVTYTWIFPSGWTITGGQNTNSVTVTVGSTNGTISVTPSNGCGSGTARTATSVIPNYRAQIISASYGSNDWCSGEERNVTVQIKNTGIATWNSGYTTNIGVKWNNWSDYHSRVTAGSLAPGSTQTYTLPIKAMNATGGPSYSTNLSAGSYTLVFDVVNESSCWFGNNSGSCGPGNSIYSTSSINVKSIPSNVTAGTDNSICSGNSTILNGSATAPNGLITIVSDNFSSNTGWSLGSGWSIASATASSSCSGTYQDPSTDYTSNTSDNKILGYVIGGCYESSLASAVYATSPAYNLTGYTNVSLSFYRILGIESSTYDHASIDVYNGTSWVNIYNHNAGSFSDASWTNFSYDISAYVNANFKVRFGIGSTDGSVQYCGWNIDDFSITGTGALSVTYSWTGTNIISGGTTSQPTINPTSSQTYTMTATSNGCSVSDDVIITVKNPTFSTQPQATSICSNSSGSFSVATNAYSPSYQWQYSSDNLNWANTDGASGVSGHTTNTLTLTNADISWNGLFIRCVLTSEGCSKNSNAVVLTVNALPSTVSVTGGGAICSGNSATLSASNGSSGTIYWQNTTSGGTSTATASTSQLVSSAGTYYFRAKSAEGCWGAEGSTNITVNALPTVSISGNSTICVTESTNLTASGAITYVWDNASSATTRSVSPSSNTTYSVTGTDANNCSNTANITITVNTPSIPYSISGKEYYIWRGNQSSAYETVGNWYHKGTNNTWSVASSLPSSGADVIIPSGTCVTNAPLVTSTSSTADSLVILSGANLTISGSSTRFTVENDLNVKTGGALILASAGILEVRGGSLKFNSGSTFTPNNGTVEMHYRSGHIDAHVIECADAGNNSFYNLNFHGDQIQPGDTAVALNSNITVTNELKVVSANLRLNGKTLTLGSNATLVEGSNGKKVFDYGADGKIVTTRTIGDGGTSDFGGLGLTVTLPNGKSMGSTTVERYTRKNAMISVPDGLSGLDGLGNQPIERFFRVTPTINGTTQNPLNATVVFNYKSASFNSQDEPSFAMYRRASGDTEWQKLEGSLSTNSRTLTVTNFPRFSDVTLGGGGSPLPVELVSFSGVCEDGIIDLTWQTASEFNSSHFNVEKSRDGENWLLLSTIPSAGTSNELITYQSADQNATDGNNYFRLRQVDIDGKEKLHEPINVSCSEVIKGYFLTFPNPSGNSFQVVLNNKELIGACVLNIVDASGKVIEQRNIEVKDGINMFVVNQEMAPGIYFLNISNGQKSSAILRHAVK